MSQRTIIKIYATLPQTNEGVEFQMLADRGLIESVPPARLKTDLQEFLKEIRVDAPFGLERLKVSYSMAEDVEMPEFGNLLVEVNLPYCLKIPSGYDMVVKVSEGNYSARVIFQKIWTESATGSSRVDFYAKDRTTFFNKAELITGKLPHRGEVGWDLKYQGKNIEKMRDNNGVFRYTKLSIFFQDKFKMENDTKSSLDKLESAINDEVVRIVNRILDAYRFSTKESFVERLASVNVINIYFYDSNNGFYPITANVQGAMINRSEDEIRSIEKMLSRDLRPPLTDLLTLNSVNSFEKKSFTLSLVENFQAFEIFVENFLIKKLKERGMPEETVEEMLTQNQNWRTKTRLKELMKIATDHSLFEDKRALWERWCALYDKVRNEVIHRGKELSPGETKNALDTNGEVIQWLKSF